MLNVILNLKNGKVTCDGIELHINPQATKRNGEGDPVVSLKKVPGWTEGMQEWKSLRQLNEGDNEITIGEKAKKTSIINLTQEEKEEIEMLENRIREIKENAKLRSPIKPKKLEEYSIEELKEFIVKRQQELGQ